MAVAATVELEAGYILHSRAYQETSQLLEVLTERHGRTGLVARGSRRPASRLRGILQPFQALRLSWHGRGSLYTMRAAEPAGWQPPLAGRSLLAAFYLNELLLAFLRRGDAHPELFADYDAALWRLRDAPDPEPVLRCFELRLLAEIGYGLNLGHDAVAEQPLDPAQLYEYVIEHGPVPAAAGRSELVFSGAELASIGRMDFEQGPVLQSAKRLLRAVLAHHLGGRPLRTRSVMAAMRR
jgi:DNA repair protein RecO (recombination protein O)